MKIPVYQIDAFTEKLFSGNPAAVCPLDHWLEDSLLQNIALENNLSETAFFVPLSENRFHLRWFTPELEMDLCGHATLATAFVIFESLGYLGNKIEFDTKSGLLKVKKLGDYLELDFPSRPPQKTALPPILSKGLNIQPQEVWKARDYLLVYPSEKEITQILPNVEQLNQLNLDPGGIIVTAEGLNSDVDFVSRFFTPQAGLFEDPVTGSAHCSLVPFWADRLHKTTFKAHQLSKRGGTLLCELKNNRVYIRGKAVRFLEGTIEC
jgi:predicted PhzF superfamily epimerase YddE/YHI9